MNATRPEPTVANILAVLDQATRGERRAGAAWYDEAQNLAWQISPLDMNKGAGVIAALSPNTSWERNKELAIRAFADGEASGTLSANVAKANAIMADTSATPLDILSGPKVRNFYMAIVGNWNAVCVDRHAMEVAYATRYKNDERPSLTPKQYDAIADQYRGAAAWLTNLPYKPAQLQAITWLVWRRIHLTGTRYERFL